MTRKTKIWIILLAVLVFSGILIVKDELVSLNQFQTETLVNEDSLKFNSEAWKKKREFYEDIRPYMLKDLMTNVLVVGMDSTTVKNFLGETWGPHNSRWWYYRLGIYREIEASYLQIEFDDDGKFKNAKIIDR